MTVVFHFFSENSVRFEYIKNDFMKKKTSKLVIVLAIIVICIAAISAGIWWMSHGTIKITTNIVADTIKVTDEKNNVLFTANGTNATEKSFLPANNYTIVVSSAGYETVKKEIDLGWMHTVSEAIILQPDTGAHPGDVEAAANLLIGKWESRFGKSTMILMIDDVYPGSINGKDETEGKSRKVSGTWKYDNLIYNLTLNEPGDKVEDGQFSLTIKENEDEANGVWTSFDKTTKNVVSFKKVKSGNSKKAENGQQANNKPVLRILNASYGSPWKKTDVTAQLNNKINNNNIYVEVSTRTFGDPDPMKPKQLTVSYEYKGMVYNKIVRDKGIFRVP
jgi:hypothetical protein